MAEREMMETWEDEFCEMRGLVEAMRSEEGLPEAAAERLGDALDDVEAEVREAIVSMREAAGGSPDRRRHGYLSRGVWQPCGDDRAPDVLEEG